MAKEKHTCQAIVVTCMDFRLQKYIEKWTDENIKGGYDKLALAGAVKDLPFVTNQIALSIKLHRTREAYLINHEDCGAYGKTGTFAKHRQDLLFAKKILGKKFPSLKISLLYLKLNGKFVKV